MALVAGPGASGFAAGGPSCVQTKTDADAYDGCPALSHVATVQGGRSGFVEATCEDGGVTYKKVDFDCTDMWWVADSDLESASDWFC